MEETIKVSEMTSATQINDDDLFMIIQDGENKKANASLINKNKLDLEVARVFNTTQEMLQDTKLINNQKVQTLGYYEVNDGGGAYYYITNQSSSTEYQVSTATPSLYARLVVEDGKVNIKQLGAKGNGVADDTQAIQTSFDMFNYIYIPDGTFVVKSPITLSYASDKTYTIKGSGSDYNFEAVSIKKMSTILVSGNLFEPKNLQKAAIMIDMSGLCIEQQTTGNLFNNVWLRTSYIHNNRVRNMSNIIKGYLAKVTKIENNVFTYIKESFLTDGDSNIASGSVSDRVLQSDSFISSNYINAIKSSEGAVINSSKIDLDLHINDNFIDFFKELFTSSSTSVINGGVWFNNLINRVLRITKVHKIGALWMYDNDFNYCNATYLGELYPQETEFSFIENTDGVATTFGSVVIENNRFISTGALFNVVSVSGNANTVSTRLIDRGNIIQLNSTIQVIYASRVVAKSIILETMSAYSANIESWVSGTPSNHLLTYNGQHKKMGDKLYYTYFNEDTSVTSPLAIVPISNLDVARTFNTTQDMLAATDLSNGQKVMTLGYYSVNDGGGATFYITNQSSSTEYQIAIGSTGLYARLIVEDGTVNMLQIGKNNLDSTINTNYFKKFKITGSFEVNSEVTLNGLTFDNAKITSSETLICYDCKFENCYFTRKVAGSEIKPMILAYNKIDFVNNKITGTTFSTCYLDIMQDCVCLIDNNTFDNNSKWDILMSGTGIISNNIFEKHTVVTRSNAVKLSHSFLPNRVAADADINNTGANGITITGNTMFEHGDNAIDGFTTSVNCCITSNIIHQGNEGHIEIKAVYRDLPNDGSSSLSTRYSRNTIISSNVFIGDGVINQYGITLRFTNESTQAIDTIPYGFIISNNTFDNVLKVFNLAGIHNCVVQGNTAKNCGDLIVNIDRGRNININSNICEGNMTKFINSYTSVVENLFVSNNQIKTTNSTPSYAIDILENGSYIKVFNNEFSGFRASRIRSNTSVQTNTYLYFDNNIISSTDAYILTTTSTLYLLSCNGNYTKTNYLIGTNELVKHAIICNNQLETGVRIFSGSSVSKDEYIIQNNLFFS